MPEHQLRSWKLLERFRKLLLAQMANFPTPQTQEDPRRSLLQEDYFCLHLFSLFNPVLKGMRGLCRASHQPKMRQVCTAPVSPGSFSEAQHLFDPEILSAVVRDLAAQAQPCFGDARLREAVKVLTAVDGTVWRAVNRMSWAPAAGYGCAVRLHLEFNVFDQVPSDWTLTPANRCERKVWNGKVQAGRFYVADRLYSNDHHMLQRVRQCGADFVLRLNGNVILTPEEQPRPLSEEDRRAGVVWDRRMRLGSKEGGPVFRVVRVEGEGREFLLVTTREDLPAEMIGQIYRYRWQIELFFKWIKSLWSAAHWIAESPQGVAIQIYTLFIGALMLTIWVGNKPSIRQIEALQMYWTGMADDEGFALLMALEEKARKKIKSTK